MSEGGFVEGTRAVDVHASNCASVNILVVDERPERVLAEAQVRSRYPPAIASTRNELFTLLFQEEWWLGLVMTGLGDMSSNQIAGVLRESRRVHIVSMTSHVGEGRTGGSVERSPWLLDRRQRCVLGFEMSPLRRGEFLLLQFLGAHANRWYSSYELCRSVYTREDPAARQLVWKYWSVLKRKLGDAAAEELQGCRRRGYRSLREVVVLDSEGGRFQDGLSSATATAPAMIL
jgi:hypothetical protein